MEEFYGDALQGGILHLINGSPVVNNSTSEQINITTGVPQGSVLGPVLFLIYVNDIGNVIVNSKEKLMLFADDSNAFVVNKTLKELKHNAEILMLKLSAWFATNKLTLNLEKTNFSIFHPPRKKIPVAFDNIQVLGVTIKRVSHVRYLGILLDDKLNWGQHINFLCHKLTKILSAFKLIKNLVPIRYRHQLYYAYHYSRYFRLEIYIQAIYFEFCVETSKTLSSRCIS